MLKKTITFEDIDGNTVTEDYHFNVTRTDMIDLLVEKPEMEGKLLALTETMDGRSIVALLKEFILLGVGKRPEGSRQFVKTPEVINDFRYSGAYDSLLWELANNPPLANEFLEGLFPKSLLDEIQKSGSIDELKAKAVQLRQGETIVDLPQENVKNPQSFVEIATPGTTIEHTEGEVVDVTGPTPFPNSLPEAITATRSGTETSENDRPAWLKELREPTSKELLEMSKGEMALAFRLREEGKLNTQNK